VLDLYQGVVDGRPLGQDEYVISADEKTSIQARCRCHATLPPGRARSMRVEHEYERGGALAYLAAWDVHHARLFGRCEPSTGIAPFGHLVAQVMTTEPYASARRVFWVVDNGSSHRGQASIDRLLGQKVAATPMRGWGGEIADRHVRCVFSNEPVERLALLGTRVHAALAAAGARNRAFR
jgi:hypothetical protein